MGTRREFLQIAVAISTLPIAGTAIAASRAQPARRGGPSLGIYKIIYDERFPASVQFARQANSAGLAVHAIRGDVTSVWFHDLSVRWKQGTAAVAGVTAPAALFCLERLAWDYGMRCVYHSEHRDEAGGAWVPEVAALITQFPAQRAVATEATQVGLPRTPNDHALTLVSWVIAPVTRTLIAKA